jgi:phosphohistidine phosphatase SixA
MIARALRIGLLVALAAIPATPTLADLKPDLAAALRQGGYVIVMRHASSPMGVPAKADADPENVGLERQLDEKGRQSAAAMGAAFRSLRISVGKVFSSPTYRALETIRLAEFGQATTEQALGDGGQSMAAVRGSRTGDWLHAAVAQVPAGHTNTLIITHSPNIAAAFPDHAKELQDGEALVFKPDGRGQSQFVAAVTIDDWARAAAARK